MSDSRHAIVELTIRYGDFGEQAQTVAVQIDERLARELMGRVELSDDPLSLLLASPGMYGGKGDALTIRREKFRMRRETAKAIANSMVPALCKAFGINDERNGYRDADLSDEERAAMIRSRK